MYYLATDKGFCSGLGELLKGGMPLPFTNIRHAKEYASYQEAMSDGMILKGRNKVKIFEIMKIVNE